MAIYQRGDVWWFEFVFRGERYRKPGGSTKSLAKIEEGKCREALEKGEKGITPKKAAPSLLDFIEDRFEPWAKNQFEKSSPKTWRDWYRNNLRAIKAYKPLAEKPLDEITSEDSTAFGAFRRSAGLKVSSANSSLRVLRRVLRIANEWGVLKGCPKIQLIRGEEHRVRVVSPLEEAKFLAACPSLLYEVATVLFDTGFRPDECFRLKWENIRWTTGRHGSLLNTFGKTKAAHRELPMTPRVREVLQARHKRAGEPVDGFVFPAETQSGHIMGSSLRKQIVSAFAAINEHAKKHHEKPVAPFVLYALRHTFLTRLGASGCSAWTLATIAGHSSIVMSQRYVHTDQETVLKAMAAHQLPTTVGSPHKSPHSGEKQVSQKGAGRLLTQ